MEKIEYRSLGLGLTEGEKVLCLLGFIFLCFAGAYVEPSKPDFQIVSRVRCSYDHGMKVPDLKVKINSFIS
jgi:hypothetical protein